MSKRHIPLIPANMAQKIHQHLCSAPHQAIHYIFGKFCAQEPFIGLILEDSIRNYAKVVILNTMLNHEAPNDPAIFGTIQPTDPVSDCNDVTLANSQICTILKIFYLYGLYSGRAMSKSEFDMNFDLDSITTAGETLKKATEAVVTNLENKLEDALESSEKESRSPQIQPHVEPPVDGLPEILDDVQVLLQKISNFGQDITKHDEPMLQINAHENKMILDFLKHYGINFEDIDLEDNNDSEEIDPSSGR